MNIIKSMWTYHCPKCRTGKLYKSPFQFSKPLDMYDRCEVCNENFMPEPGFYFGAMFLSYIMSGWFFLIPALILVFVFDWNVGPTMVFVLVLAALIHTKLLRLSRAIWIHIIVKYDKKHQKK